MGLVKVMSSLILISIFPPLGAQQKNVLEDVFIEQDNNSFTIRFFDVLTGDPVSDAFVMIENVGSYSTDSEGSVIFPRQPDGPLKAVFKKTGYISALIEIDVVVETILRNRYFVSTVMDIDQFRVALSWDQQPEDIDAHLVKSNAYHISFRNTRVLNDGTGQLDRDDMDGYGPETITISQLSPESEYTYFIYNYSAKVSRSAPPLSSSKATVWVYGNNKLLNTFHMPTNLKGDTWQVFKVVQGQVVIDF
ncbi:MAG: hypothetical protein EHM93_12280 [Bacteroidales bacterium]|nr:MAG: hypothetical protein EHM93_12280 [Bacteroidales bacterium]